MESEAKQYTLLGANGKPYQSASKGTLGGYRARKIYGRLACKNALDWIAKGHYVANRVFFADEQTAIAAGYHPCGKCMKEKHALWKRSASLGKAARGEPAEQRREQE